MLPIFGIIPWKHHLLITSKCKSVEEAFYYMARVIDEGLSKRELADVIDNGDFGKQGKAITNFASQLATHQSQLAASVLKDPYRLDFLMLERGYNERDLENAIAKDITRFCLNWVMDLPMSADSPNLLLVRMAISPTCFSTTYDFVVM